MLRASILPRFRRAGVRRRRGAGLGAAPRGRPRHRDQPAADVRRALPPVPPHLLYRTPRTDAPSCDGSLLSPGEEAFNRQQGDEAATGGRFGQGKGNQRNMRR